MKEQSELVFELIQSIVKVYSDSPLPLPIVMDCPRCGFPLAEHLPDQKWRRHFECRECWLAFSFYSGVLQPGRDPNPQFLVKG